MEERERKEGKKKRRGKRNININNDIISLEVFTKLHKFSIKIQKSSRFWGGHIPLRHAPPPPPPPVYALGTDAPPGNFPNLAAPFPPSPRQLGLAKPLLATKRFLGPLRPWWERMGNIRSSFLGNLGIWRESLEFGGKLCLFVLQNTLNRPSVGNLSCFQGREHFFPALIKT